MRLPDPGRRAVCARPTGGARSSIRAALRLTPSVLALLIVLLGLPAVAVAASPEPTAVAAGDPRSSGQGPGLVGDPLAAIIVVAVIAGLAIAATLLYVRVTGGPTSAQPRR
jgi:hypothetical protein